MPNWVSNRLTIEGENAEKIMQELMTKDEESGELALDFNKIIPMPKSLQLSKGNVTNMCVSLYLTAINPSIYHYGHAKDKAFIQRFIGILEKIKKHCDSPPSFNLSKEKIKQYEKLVFSTTDENDKLFTRKTAIAHGKLAINNVLKYGHMDWYDWSIANWGTKWNAVRTSIDGAEVCFDTAWSDVSRLIYKLSKKYPDNTFHYSFAEEQAGYYTGEFSYTNGHEEGDYFPEYSKEAYELYFDFWGNDDLFNYNEETGNYDHIDDKNNVDDEAEM